MIRDFIKRNANPIIILSFLFLSIIVLVIIIRSLTYFNTDADRSEILNQKTHESALMIPQQYWKNETDGDSLLLVDLKKNYTQFWEEKFKSERLKDPSSLKYYLNHKAEDSLELYLENKEQFMHEVNKLVEHHPTIKFFSADGHIAVIEDSAMQFVHHTYRKNKLVERKWLQQKIKSTWIFTAGLWQVRHLNLLEEKTINPYEKQKLPFKVIENQTHLNSIKGTNYYPQKQAWNNMWQDFDAATIEKDLQLIKESGLNTIRVFIPYDEWGRDKVSYDVLTHFRTFLDLCEENQIKVIPTLFDFFGQYQLENYTFADQHLKSILTTFKDHNAIVAWDIKNEPDLDFKHYGRQQVLNWLEFILSRAKKYDPLHSLTIGWSSPDATHQLVELQDFISFHYYLPLEEFETKYQKVQDNAKDKAIVISEFGQSSYSSAWYPFSKNEYQQLEYYQKIFQKFKEVGHQSFLHWTLYDFTEVPDKVVGSIPWRKNIQKHYGFIDAMGEKKPAYQVIDGNIDNSEEVTWKKKLNKTQIGLIVLILSFVVILVLFIKKRYGYQRIRASFK